MTFANLLGKYYAEHNKNPVEEASTGYILKCWIGLIELE